MEKETFLRLAVDLSRFYYSLDAGGPHPFADNLVRHLRCFVAGASVLWNGGEGPEQGCSGYEGEAWPDQRVVAELAANMARIAAGERGEDSETILAEEDAARDARSRFTVATRRRVRYWTDGAVIGSELFVREIAAKLFGCDRAKRKRLAKGSPPGASDSPLFAYRQLNPAL